MSNEKVKKIRKKTRRGLFMEIYEELARFYGPRRWWPVTQPGGEKPEYTGGPKNPSQRFEVAVGAVLTQNTAWKNAAGAIANLNRAGKLTPESICGMDETGLAEMIRPSGYYNRKAKRLKILASFFVNSRKITRSSLLELNGIGPETADSIMLYAFNNPYFVVDAYTRRMFGRLGLIDDGASYEEIRSIFERNLPRRTILYKEYHALIVENAKRFCRRRPVCAGCIILRFCSGALNGSAK